MLGTGMSESYRERLRARAVGRLYKRLQSRMRLEKLAAASSYVSQADRELERLKYHYLPMWAELRRRDSIERGLPSESKLTDYMKPSVREFDQTAGAEPDREACKVIEQSIDELVGAGGFRLARAVLAVRYLNAKGASVFRSGRTVHLEPQIVEGLCDRAERQLVPIVKRRGLPL